MSHWFAGALGSAILLSSSALGSERKAHGQVDLKPKGKQLVLVGPGHVSKLTTSGKGTARLFQVTTSKASSAGCTGPPAASGFSETVSHSGSKEADFDVPAGNILCAELTAGTSFTLSWEGADSGGPTAKASGANDGELKLPDNQPRLMLKGPARFSQFATGGDGPIQVYLAPGQAGTDADCMLVPGDAGQAPPTAASTTTLPPRMSEKSTLQVAAGQVACARLLTGRDAKIIWKAE